MKAQREREATCTTIRAEVARLRAESDMRLDAMIRTNAEDAQRSTAQAERIAALEGLLKKAGLEIPQ